MIKDYLTWYLWNLKSYIKDMQRTEFRLALLWLICISETSDLIQSSAVHWESAYMCTKSFLHEKIMSYFSSFVCECASPTYHYVKWNYEYGCWYSMAMSLNIQCPMVKWFCLMMFFLIWIAALLLVFFIKWKLLTWIRYVLLL